MIGSSETTDWCYNTCIDNVCNDHGMCQRVSYTVIDCRTVVTVIIGVVHNTALILSADITDGL